MTRITFEADRRLLEAARQTAAAERRRARVAEWNAISKTVDSGGRKFTREEMNAR